MNLSNLLAGAVFLSTSFSLVSMEPSKAERVKKLESELEELREDCLPLVSNYYGKDPQDRVSLIGQVKKEIEQKTAELEKIQAELRGPKKKN